MEVFGAEGEGEEWRDGILMGWREWNGRGKLSAQILGWCCLRVE